MALVYLVETVVRNCVQITTSLVTTDYSYKGPTWRCHLSYHVVSWLEFLHLNKIDQYLEQIALF